MGGGAATGEGSLSLPGGHLLRLWTCSSAPCLLEQEMMAGVLYLEKSLVLSCLTRIHSRGLPTDKGTQQQEAVCYATRAGLKSGRRGLMEQDHPH